MEIEKVYRILAIFIGTATLLVGLASFIFFPDADHHLWMLCVFLPAIIAAFSRKKGEHKRS